MGYSAVSRRRSSGALIIVSAIHLILVYAAVHFSSILPQPSQLQGVIRLIQLPSETKNLQQDIAEPAPVVHKSSLYLNLPFPESYQVEPGNRQVPPDSDESLYRKGVATIFDPRLQQKLQDAAERSSRSVVTQESSWVDATGKSHVNIGNGKCMKSVVPIKSGSATDWELPGNCGVSESEKMLKNIAADLAKSKREKNR